MADNNMRDASDPKLAGPKRKVNLGQAAKGAKKSILRHFAFENNERVKAVDRRTLRRMAQDRLYEATHSARTAEQLLNKVLEWIAHIEDLDSRLLETKVTGDYGQQLQQSIDAGQRRVKALKTILDEIRADRVRRQRDLVELEHDLEDESRRQRREDQLKVARNKQEKKAAQVRLDQHEEDGSPTLTLDPTLLAQATKALTLEPKDLNPGFPLAKKTGKSKKTHTNP